MFLAEIAAIRNDLELRCLCKATPEKVKSTTKMAESKSKIVILIYYHIKVSVWKYNVQWSRKKANYTKD